MFGVRVQGRAMGRLRHDRGGLHARLGVASLIAFIGLCLGGSVALAPALAAASSVVAPGTGLARGAEIASLRTASSRTFVGPNGTLEAHIYPVAVNYKNASGDWQPIDNTLVPGTDGALAGYINGANRLHVELPKVLGTAPVHVSDGPQWLRFSLDGGTGLGSTSGPTETFANALPGVDLTYSMTNTALKENLILAGPTSPQSFSYTVSTSADLAARAASDGSIAFVDGSGTPKFSFMAPVMSDAAGQDSRASYSLTNTPTGYTVTLNADTAWLNSPDRVWPVTIDPTVPDDSGYYPTTGSLSPTSDGYIVDGANASQNFFGLTVDKVGWNSSNIRHGLFQFNAEGALPAGAQVLDAELKLYLSSESTSATTSVGVYQMVTDPWTSSATWNTYDGTHSWTTAGGDYTSDSLGHAWATSTVGGSTGTGFYYNWQITQLVAGWSGSTMPDHGLVVKDVNETTNANVFSFNSSHATSNLPYISVQYEYGVGSRPTYTFSDFPLADTMSGSVNVGNGNLLLCQTDLNLPGSDGFDLTLNRCLNSLTQGDITNQNEQLDTNWTMTPGQAAYLDSVNGNLVYHDDNGDLVPFTQDGSGSYVNATAFNGSLSLTSGTLSACSGHSYGYVLTFDADGSKQYFSGTTGRLQAEADANGNTICFTYGSNIYGSGTILTSITDTQGREITFHYLNNANLTLSSITWPGSNCTSGTCTISYGYDANNDLTSVTDPSGAQTIYGYNASKQLTSVQDADGNTTIFAYTLINGYGPAVSSITDAKLKQTTFAYNVSGSLCTSPATETDVTDPNQGVTHYCHDNGLRVSETKAPDGTLTQTAYTATSQSSNCVDQYGDSLDNQPCSGQDGNQNTNQESYSSSAPQDLTSETDGLSASGVCPSGAICPVTSYAYGDSSHPFYPTLESAPADSTGHKDTTSYTYDTNGNVLSSTTGLNADGTCPSGSTCPKTTYTYDSAGRVLTEVAPLGNVTGNNRANYTTTYAYDSSGHLLSVTDPLGHATAYTYDGQGNEATVTDANGNRTVYSYDADNRVTSMQSGLRYDSTTQTYHCLTGDICPTTSYTYDSNGNLKTETDPRGHVTTYTYDADNRVLSATTPLGEKTTYGYDNKGNQTTVVDPRGNVTGNNPADYTTTSAYDKNGSILSVTDPLGDKTSYTYDGNGNVLTRTDANNHTTTYTYDSQGDVLTVTAPDGSVTTYTYDGNGNVLTRTDANNHTTTYTYDNNGNLSSETGPDPDGSGPQTAPVTSYSYDANGNLSQEVEPNGDTITYTYDHANRQTGTSYAGTPATPAVSYGYDAAGNRTSMTDGAGTLNYTYDNNNRLLAASRGSDTFSYAYDAAGNTTSRTYPGGTATTYSFDNDNRLASVTSSSNTTSYSYDAAGNLTQATLPASNGYVETRTYDHAGRLTELDNKKNGTALSDFAYTLDPVGNPTQAVRTGSISSTTTYGYDANDRLTSVCLQASCPNQSDPKTSFTYDKNGNRLTKVQPSGTTNYTYNNDDELTSAGSTNYTYDANGNETAAGSRSFTYNAANQMTSTTASGATTTYTYDGSGNRLTETGSGTTTNYLWDTNNALPQLALERDGSGNVLRSYLYGHSRISMTTGGSTYYYTYDNLGSVANLTSSTGTTEWTYAYQAFGGTSTQTQNDPSAPANPMQFTGEFLDSASALYHLRAREYDPSVGRLLSEDPLPSPVGTDDLSLYAYVDDQPTTHVDPSGQKKCGAGPNCAPTSGDATAEDLLSYVWDHRVQLLHELVGWVKREWSKIFSGSAGGGGSFSQTFLAACGIRLGAHAAAEYLAKRVTEKIVAHAIPVVDVPCTAYTVYSGIKYFWDVVSR